MDVTEVICFGVSIIIEDRYGVVGVTSVSGLLSAFILVDVTNVVGGIVVFVLVMLLKL